MLGSRARSAVGGRRVGVISSRVVRRRIHEQLGRPRLHGELPVPRYRLNQSADRTAATVPVLVQLPSEFRMEIVANEEALTPRPTAHGKYACNVRSASCCLELDGRPLTGGSETGTARSSASASPTLKSSSCSRTTPPATRATPSPGLSTRMRTARLTSTGTRSKWTTKATRSPSRPFCGCFPVRSDHEAPLCPNS